MQPLFYSVFHFSGNSASPDTGKQLRQNQLNGSVLYVKFRGIEETGRLAVVAALCGGIKDPNIGDPKLSVAGHALLHAPQSIFRRKDLNAGQRWFGQDLLDRAIQ